MFSSTITLSYKQKNLSKNIKNIRSSPNIEIVQSAYIHFKRKVLNRLKLAGNNKLYLKLVHMEAN